MALVAGSPPLRSGFCLFGWLVSFDGPGARPTALLGACWAGPGFCGKRRATTGWTAVPRPLMAPFGFQTRRRAIRSRLVYGGLKSALQVTGSPEGEGFVGGAGEGESHDEVVVVGGAGGEGGVAAGFEFSFEVQELMTE